MARGLRTGVALSFFLASLFAVFSCADGNDIVLMDTSDTLRAKADARDAETLWTAELEGDRLLNDIGAGDAVPQTPMSAVAAATLSAPVYPFLEGFGSLDTSLISPEIRASLAAFCDLFLSGEAADSCMADGSLFSYVLFLDDVKIGWREHFSGEMPSVSREEPLFDSTLYGAPFIDENGCEVPVRFSGDAGRLDILIYFEFGDGGDADIAESGSELNGGEIESGANSASESPDNESQSLDSANEPSDEIEPSDSETEPNDNANELNGGENKSSETYKINRLEIQKWERIDGN